MNLTQTEKTAVILILLALVAGSIILMTRRRAAPMTVTAALTGVASPDAGAGADAEASTDSADSTGGGSEGEGRYTRLVVHVGGNVKTPGVYYLQPGSRVVDAVTAAGGGTAEADLDSLNLAEPLSDGQKVSIPGFGTSNRAAGDAPSGEGPVNVNTAPESELDGLPGIGPAIASRIVAHRKSKGPFASIKDLEDVPGIGPKMVEKLSDLAVAK